LQNLGLRGEDFLDQVLLDRPQAAGECLKKLLDLNVLLVPLECECNQVQPGYPALSTLSQAVYELYREIHRDGLLDECLSFVQRKA
jgi:hypothetical protein